MTSEHFRLSYTECRDALVKRLEREMLEKAKRLEFEAAAVLRDEIEKLKDGRA